MLILIHSPKHFIPAQTLPHLRLHFSPSLQHMIHVRIHIHTQLRIIYNNIWNKVVMNTNYNYFLHKLQPLHPIAHSYSFTQTFHSSTDIATPSPPLFTFTPTHDSRPHTHSHPVTYYLSVYAQSTVCLPHLINTNVGPITHPYYTKYLPHYVHDCCDAVHCLKDT